MPEQILPTRGTPAPLAVFANPSLAGIREKLRSQFSVRLMPRKLRLSSHDKVSVKPSTRVGVFRTARELRVPRVASPP